MTMRFCLTLLFVVAVWASPVAAQNKSAPKTGSQPPAKSGRPAAKAPAKNTGSANKGSAPSGGKKAPAGDKAKADPSKPAQADSGDTALAKFDNIFADWRELLSKLQDLRSRYIATPRKGGLREPIKEEYDQLVKQGEQLEPKVIEAAAAAFPTARDTRPEIGTFLIEQLKYYFEHDNYEPAVTIARTLIDNGFENPRVYHYGGVAAFGANDFDDAEKWLQEGDKHGVLDVKSKQILSRIKQYEELWKTEQELRAAEAKADDLPRVLLKTNKGDITLELFENEAPNTVANFISLVEKGFYDGVKFHRVLATFMAQGGDPDDGTGGPGYNIPDETDRSDYRMHFRGSLSMANTGRPNSGGSQFFIMFRPSGPAADVNLNGKHTVFGRVIDGFDVLSRIQRIDPQKPEEGVKADKIIEAKVLRKRGHAYVPKKAGEDKPSEPANEDGGDKSQ